MGHEHVVGTTEDERSKITRGNRRHSCSGDFAEGVDSMHGTTHIDDKVPTAWNNLSDNEQYDGDDVLLTLQKEVEGKLSARRNMSLHGPHNFYCIHSTQQGSI